MIGMNIDINRDVAVRFDGDGRPVNCWGEIIYWQPGQRMVVSSELMESILRAREEIDDQGSES